MAVLKSTSTVLLPHDLSQIPAAQAPEGLSSNFVHSPSLGSVYRVVIYIFMPMMSALIVLRLGDRLRQMHKLEADDCVYMKIID